MLYEYLKERMLDNPLKIIDDGTLSFTYTQIISYAQTFGETLKTNKYGILCKSDLDTAKALLACFYAKKTAVPLSYRYGEKHNNKIIESIGISHLITEKGIEAIKEPRDEIEDLSDVALILCTSGTTGDPKGAMITYDNLLTNLSDIERYFRIDNTDKILISRPLYHCAVLTGELLISLIKGLDIVFLNGDFSPVRLLNEMEKHNITVFCGTPTMFYHICKSAEKGKRQLHIKASAVSGECMTRTAAGLMREALPRTDIYHVYGLTEASPRVSFLPPGLFDKYPDCAGYPLSSLKIKIENGELLIKGGSVMKGYYNDPAATDAAIADGWLHTGDIAQIDDCGRIWIRTRKDSMIIRAGINIYPQEIENALKTDDRISDVLAFGVKDNIVGRKIHLKVVTELPVHKIYELCRQKLTIYQLPDFIEITEEIPKNASGKVIRM